LHNNLVLRRIWLTLMMTSEPGVLVPALVAASLVLCFLSDKDQ
jgi:hypothetical protein